MKLASWKEVFERRLDSLGIISAQVSNEEECDVSKHAGNYEDEERLANWIKVDPWIL